MGPYFIKTLLYNVNYQTKLFWNKVPWSKAEGAGLWLCFGDFGVMFGSNRNRAALSPSTSPTWSPASLQLCLHTVWWCRSSVQRIDRSNISLPWLETRLMRAGFADWRYTKWCDKFPPTIPPTHLNWSAKPGAGLTLSQDIPSRQKLPNQVTGSEELQNLV